MAKKYDAVIKAPFGAVGICVQDDFLTEVVLLPTAMAEKSSRNDFVQLVISQLALYFSNPDTSLNIPFAVKGTLFQKRVWQTIATIPCGQTLTYSELATKVGSGPRAVANVCGVNQVPLLIPCHRVIAKNGLGGFMRGKENGLKVKKWLLNHEASVKGNV